MDTLVAPLKRGTKDYLLGAVVPQLTSNGVRTCLDLNVPGSLKASRALAMSTTAAAITSCGAAVVFVTRGLLSKAARSRDDQCHIELSLALSHAQAPPRRAAAGCAERDGRLTFRASF